MIRGSEEAIGGGTGTSDERPEGLGYPCAGTVARAARSPMGRHGPEQHEQDRTAE